MCYKIEYESLDEQTKKDYREVIRVFDVHEDLKRSIVVNLIIL